jgi:molecular chaperone DnaK (HSP70)
LGILWRHVDEAKAALARGTKRVTLRVRIEGKLIEETLSYQSLGSLGADLLQHLEQLTAKVMMEAGVRWEDLDHVLLAGSGARLPFVHETVKRWSGGREIFSLAGPEVASEGAALLAENLVGTRHSTLDFRTQEIATHSYEIRSKDPNSGAEVGQVVIPRNSPLPAAKRVAVAKHEARQAEISFQVLEIGGAAIDQATPLGTGTIRSLPPGLAVGVPVDVEIGLDSRGILSLSTYSLATGRRCEPEYQPVIGIDADERARWRTWLTTLGR